MNFSKKNHELQNSNIILVSKTIIEQFKSITLILDMLIFFQGCTFYKSANVTLEEAAKSETKVRVEKKNRS